jgi:hypothetical protein
MGNWRGAGRAQRCPALPHVLTLLGKRYRLCHNWRNEIVARAE